MGSILRPLLFNIFIKDLFYFIKDAQHLNFADDNAIAIFSNNVDDLITELQKEYEKDWFSSNEMAVNSDKFQSIIINRLEKLEDSYKLLIDNHKIYSENYVTLLRTEIENKRSSKKCSDLGQPIQIERKIKRFPY